MGEFVGSGGYSTEISNSMQHSLVDLHVKVQVSGIWCLGDYLTVVTHGLVDWHISCIQTLKQREKADPAAYPTNRYMVEGTCAREGPEFRDM